MSKVVCQGLESSSSHLVETETLIRLKLAFPKKTTSSSSSSSSFSSSSSPPPIKEINGGGGCWSFLHALSNTSTTNYSQPSTPYFHPEARPKSTLSDKSLELCTESLGSETGSHDTLDDVFPTTPSSDNDDVSKVEETTHEKQGTGFSSSSSSSPRKIIVNENNSNACKNFPPPLTTSSLRFRPHREGGRLIIAAVEGPLPPRACLRAERCHGRLRLALWRDCEENIGDGDVGGFENGENYSEENEEEEEEEEEFGEDEGEESKVYGREDVDGNSLNVGVEMGMEGLQRPSRCKEGEHGNKGLCNWEPFWVVT